MGPLVFVGDIHLGRRPSKIKDAIAQLGLKPDDLGPARALELTVSAAIEHGARAVVLAGDVVDGRRDQYEAYHILRQMLARLTEAGIMVYGVAGNHDGLVLPRLAEDLDGFHLIGRGGEWSCVQVPGDGPPVDLIGWSFQREHITHDPTTEPSLKAALAMRREDAVCYGVVHGDLDVSKSSYAPLQKHVLTQLGLDGWFLGHIHQPHDLRGPRPVGYLGSLVGLDMAETGPRGPWLVYPGHPEKTEQLQLGPIQWRELGVDVSGHALADMQDVVTHVESAIADALEEQLPVVTDTLRMVVVRARLEGRTDSRAAIRAYVEQAKGTPMIGSHKEAPVVLYGVRDHTRPEIHLEQLASQPGPAGELARQVQALEANKPSRLEGEALAVAKKYRPKAWGLPSEDYAAIDPQDLLLRACWRALEQLVATREEVGQ